MRLIIIPSDTFCSINGVGYSGIDMSSMPLDVHAVQWFETEGWVEFVEVAGEVRKPNEPITSIEPYQTVISEWETADYNAKNPPPPPPPTAAQNKQKATILLQGTDWTQIPSVADPAQSNPYLGNVDAFTAYRNQIREIAVNPVDGYISWPTQPDAVWV